MFNTFFRSKYTYILLALAFNALPCATMADAEPQAPHMKYQAEAQQVQLPDIPKYTGKSSYVGANDYKGAELNQKVVRVTYLMQEDPDIVLNWYSGALKSYQWSLQDNKNDPKRLHGSKGKATCSIYATAYNGPSYRTCLCISYRYGE